MKLKNWEADFDHAFGQGDIMDMDWVTDDIKVFIHKRFEKIVSSYMKVLDDYKFDEKTWKKIADLNGELLNRDE